ncbi:protein-disulfide reductase DsbD [uncultured Thiohalocapsa sp.]|uniref:protein-disulfide reductase DsbD family protein n=1 Tax=uncultured Thiohalocapsa sp. TaxID=768990 RepID=UPI0025DE86B3|nr:protein-disulfide reductase DsbD domain-containing protein [uncultured Thiohalocapsa sp.]
MALPAARRPMAALTGAQALVAPRGLVLLALLLAVFVTTALRAAPMTQVQPAIDAAVFDGPAASAPVITDNVRARLLAEQSRVQPGASVDLALVLDIRPHWHTYWRNPGDSGEPPRIDWQLPEGVTAGPIRWPLPAPIPVGPLVNYGYSGRAVHLVSLQVPADWPADAPIPVTAEAHWLVCEEACIPEQGRFSLTLSTDPAAADAPPGAVRTLFAEARARLPQAGVVQAVLTRGDDALGLRVPAAALPGGVSDAYFFPDAWGLVNHAAEQRWSLDADHLTLTLAPGDAAASVAATGLLTVTAAEGTVGLRLDATGAAGAPTPAGAAAASAGAADLGLPLALGFALIGGLVLNLMPCVFPVLAIKALGLAGQGGAGFGHRALHGLAYTAGVLAFFLALGLLLLGLRAGGAAVGWGFQLQSPLFVALMAYLFVVLGMSLAGALTLGTGLMGIGQGGAAQAGHLGAFVTGALAALVAAPCTAPFMGAALGYAMTVPWPAALAIVLALGLGMALPFLLLAVSPGLARRLPRPGPWMETLKQTLAFPMFATAAWLLWVLAVQTGPGGLATALTGALVLAFGLWVQEQMRFQRSPWPRVGAAAAGAGLGAALWLGVGLSGDQVAAPPTAGRAAPAGAEAAAGLPAEPYSPGRLAAALADGRPVFVNMTAAWCITCLVNERVALSRAAVARAFAERDVLYLKGDWTNRDPAITDYLAGFGRNGVPIYVFYPPGGAPRVLPQVLTEAIVLDHLGTG